MMQRLILIVFLFVGLLASPATAQQLICQTAYEAITTLRPPHLGTPPVWDAMYGPAGADIKLGTGLQLPDGAILTAGRLTEKAASQAGHTTSMLVFATINGRGRVDREKRLPAVNDERPVKILTLKNGYVMLSNITIAGRQEAQLSWLNHDLGLQQSARLADSALNIHGTAMTISGDGKSILIALNATGSKSSAGEQTILARFNVNGGKIWQRNFAFGISNAINGVAPVGRDDFVGAGHIRLDDGRLAGWILRIDARGAMVWQKTYPRGGLADLMQVTTNGAYFLLAGIVASPGGGPTGIWLLEMDLTGTPLWQRFVKAAKFSLRPAGLQTLPNGLLLTTINATGEVKPPTSSSELDHIRLVTFSPRGELASDDSYMEGGGAEAVDAAPGADDTRILIANLSPDEKTANAQGWVFIAPAPAAYKDPCGPR